MEGAKQVEHMKNNETGKTKRKGVWRVFDKARKAWRFSPLKLLCKAQNAYVQTMLDCKYRRESAVELPLPLPSKTRSCSGGSRREEENLRRLIKMTEIKLQLQLNVHEAMTETHQVEATTTTATATSIIISPRPSLAALRSSSAGSSYGASHPSTTIDPIDEESPCYFPGSFKKRWATPLPRGGSFGFGFGWTTPSS